MEEELKKEQPPPQTPPKPKKRKKTKFGVKHINISNFARRMASCSDRCVTLIVMDTCRDLYKDPIDNLEESETPMRNLLPQAGTGQVVMLYSIEKGQKAVEWAPNPANQLYYCENTFEFIRHLDRCHLNQRYSLGEVMKEYKFHQYSELYPSVMNSHTESLQVFAHAGLNKAFMSRHLRALEIQQQQTIAKAKTKRKKIKRAKEAEAKAFESDCVAKLADLDISRRTSGVMDLGNDNLAAFVCRLRKHVLVGGFDKKLLVIEDFKVIKEL